MEEALWTKMKRENSNYNDGSGLGDLGRTFSHCYGNSCGASNDNWNWTYGETAASNAGVPYTTIAKFNSKIFQQVQMM